MTVERMLSRLWWTKVLIESHANYFEKLIKGVGDGVAREILRGELRDIETEKVLAAALHADHDDVRKFSVDQSVTKHDVMALFDRAIAAEAEREART